MQNGSVGGIENEQDGKEVARNSDSDANLTRSSETRPASLLAFGSSAYPASHRFDEPKGGEGEEDDELELEMMHSIHTSPHGRKRKESEMYSLGGGVNTFRGSRGITSQSGGRPTSATAYTFDGVRTTAPKPNEQVKEKKRCVEHIAFTQALLEEKPKKWTKTMFKLYFFLFVAFLNSVINGFDGTLLGGITNMEHYKTFFHIGESGSIAGLVMSSYNVGNILGSFFCGPFTDWWGRRWGMFVGAATISIGACVQGSSLNRAMFIGGRFLLGFGIATCATAGPCYVVEMSHPAWRGPLTGFYNSFWFVGSMLASWITYACHTIPSDFSWRTPTYLQTVLAGTLCVACLFIPETPRWLYSNNKQELAVMVLQKYHGEGNRKSPIVLLTYKELVEEILIGGSDKRYWDYSDLWNSRSAWWRNACVFGMAMCSQLAGNAALTYFMSNFLEQVGVDDERTELFYYAIFNVASLIISLIGASFVDKIGRRKVLISATSIFAFCWTIITTLTGLYATTKNTNKNGAMAAIAFTNIFQLTYCFAYTPLQALYPVECLAYETRAKGMGIYNLVANFSLFFNMYGIPAIMGELGWRFYIIYACWNICQVIFIYFFFVETKGRTLEAINEIFKDPYPRKRSLQKHILLVDPAEKSILLSRALRRYDNQVQFGEAWGRKLDAFVSPPTYTA